VEPQTRAPVLRAAAQSAAPDDAGVYLGAFGNLTSLPKTRAIETGAE
jgi:hypothetical protein